MVNIKINMVDLLMFSMSLDEEKAKDSQYVINKYVEAHPELISKESV